MRARGSPRDCLTAFFRLLTSILVLSSASFAQPPSVEARGLPLKVFVHVYNYAHVSRKTLARAEREAARIFLRTGVKTEWLDCPLSPDEATQYPACWLAPGGNRLALRILSRGMSDRLKLEATTLGFATFPKDGGFGTAAYVCAHRADKLAKARKSSPGVFLGHFIAHEIGELLLGGASHSAVGIMSVPWCPRELERIAQGTMLFTSWQAKKIRAQVRARIQTEQVAHKSIIVPSE